MRANFKLNTDDLDPLDGMIKVRSTRTRIEIECKDFAVTFTDVNDVEQLAALLTAAAKKMRSNGSCRICGGKGFAVSGDDRIDCERCGGQGIVTR